MADDDEKGEDVVGNDEETVNEKKIHKDGQKADYNNKSKTCKRKTSGPYLQGWLLHNKQKPLIVMDISNKGKVHDNKNDEVYNNQDDDGVDDMWGS